MSWMEVRFYESHISFSWFLDSDKYPINISPRRNSSLLSTLIREQYDNNNWKNHSGQEVKIRKK